jgi:hypothetical protein
LTEPRTPLTGYAFTSPFTVTLLKHARIGARLRSPSAEPFWMVIHRRPRITGELVWPARLWKIETVELIDERDRLNWDGPQEQAYVRAREVVVLDELPVPDLLGPRGRELAALFDRILELAPAEAEKLAARGVSSGAPPQDDHPDEDIRRLAYAARTITWRLTARRARQIHGVSQFPFDHAQGGEVLPVLWDEAFLVLAQFAEALACGIDLPEGALA